ncbi:amidohydrolase [Sporosarcina sp. G11-34]|nr:amidohydrolase [Sporosarcina sp. G11-34]
MINEIQDEVIQWRRYLHARPELSFQEVQTSQYIYDTLKSFGGLKLSRPTETSVMARLIGSEPGKVLAIRADIDALPIEEENDFDYVSTNIGVMHACGHDGHTAILLGTAKILSRFKDQIEGEVRFLFQHGEEQLPGGAQEMIDAGVMENVDFVIGAHLWSPIEVGKVFTTSGPLMAAADIFNIKAFGKGGHSALPHHTIDSLAVGMQVVNNLQHIVSRNTDPFENLVLSVTKFTAGTSHSIIPETATIVGSVRSFNKEVRESVPEYMEQIVKGVTEAHGATYTLDYQWGYGPVINDEKATRVIQETITDIFGEKALLIQNPMMISEDFSAYQQKAPGCFFFIGAGNQEKGITYPHHHPKFSLDEKSLDIGVKIFVHAAFRFLNIQ